MLLVRASDIKKSFGDRLVIDLDRLEIHAQDRIGLVGMNGAGKTTLLNILAGRTPADEGTVKSYAGFSYFSQLSDGQCPDYYSGGEKARARFQAEFDPDQPLLYADEPTTHLDLDGILEIEQRLEQYRGAMVLVSHDRELLDRLCNRMLEIENGRVSLYEGNYSQYRRQKELERDQAGSAYHQYVEEKRRLEQVLLQTRARTDAVRKTPKRMGNSEARLHRRESGEVQKKLARTA
jgi:macrolide transport system ATP-binding/permease protein